MEAGSGGREARLYELRVRRLDDAIARERVADTLARWFPAREHPTRSRDLAGAGFAATLVLRDEEASALLRELYAAGAPPGAVVLRPRGAEAGAAETALFATFAERGGRFVPTWNWQAFIFGPFWYFRRGLYAKGLVLLILGVVPIWSLAATVCLWLAVLAYGGLAGNWDYYLWRVKGTQWW